MLDTTSLYLIKAQESLVGAESEFANRRYNNAANRAYYSCFQAAVHALIRAGIRPSGARGQWSHAFVPAQFEGELIRRRKLYPTDLRTILQQTYTVRRAADYEAELVSQAQAERALRRASRFVQAIRTGGGERR
jgi:uncharacterized protein (UPF0332 family)